MPNQQENPNPNQPKSILSGPQWRIREQSSMKVGQLKAGEEKRKTRKVGYPRKSSQRNKKAFGKDISRAEIIQ
jgi:hypothetical protein